jgi:4-diphosphocytidyl-2-C-methyl-D-erythritol kinase
VVLLESPAVIRVGAPAASVRILAPAKINIGLAILGRRGDGYHELRTIFQTVSLCDRITLRRAPGGVRVRCAELRGLGARNLAHRAAALFLAQTGVRGGVRIDLEKRIPAGGGLGGGSSDAAAVLLGCCRLFGLLPEPALLRTWAASLGSDVPFFLEGGAAVGSGRGEILEPLAPFPAAIVALLHLASAGLSTAEVYRGLKPAALTGRSRAFTMLLARWREGDLPRLGKALFNDLETPAFALAPGLPAVKEAFGASGALGALLCGSGSSVFGLFGSDGAAERARGKLRGKVPGRLVKVRFLPARRRWGVVKR